jgi:hypothetical protein
MVKPQKGSTEICDNFSCNFDTKSFVKFFSNSCESFEGGRSTQVRLWAADQLFSQKFGQLSVKNLRENGKNTDFSLNSEFSLGHRLDAPGFK